MGMAPPVVARAAETVETEETAPPETTTARTISKTYSPLSSKTSKEAPRGGLAGATQVLPTLC